MSRNTKAIETLRTYFEQKGRVMSAQEYSRQTDTPIRLQVLRAMFGSWNKVEKLVMARTASDAITDIDDVLAARNRAASEADAQWRAASENQDKKAEREAAANALATKLALNAATPEGANANKIAIGGPLPQEQPKFERLGATVNIDPSTGSREIVDPQPEEVKVLGLDIETGRTPKELEAAAAENLKGGTVDVADDTSGGSQGSASIATVAALGGGDEGSDTVEGTSKDSTVKPVVKPVEKK